MVVDSSDHWNADRLSDYLTGSYNWRRHQEYGRTPFICCCRGNVAMDYLPVNQKTIEHRTNDDCNHHRLADSCSGKLVCNAVNPICPLLQTFIL